MACLHHMPVHLRHVPRQKAGSSLLAKGRFCVAKILLPQDALLDLQTSSRDFAEIGNVAYLI